MLSLERRWRWSCMQDSKGDTDVNNRLLDSVKECEGGMLWENSTETCIYNMQNRWPGQVRCMKQGTQSQVYLWLIHVIVEEKVPKDCKVIILQLE